MINHLLISKRVFFCSSLCGITLGLASCVNYFGIHHKQHLVKPEHFATKKSIVSCNGVWPTTDWSKQFDSNLPLLINEAVANNPDLHVAIARQKQAEALVGGRNAALLPKAEFLGLGARNKAIFPLVHQYQNFV